MNDFWPQFKQRRVGQWTIAYVVCGWLVLQVVGYLIQRMAWAPMVFQGAVVVVLAGLVATLIIAWNHGERGAQRVTPLEVAMLAMVVLIALTGVAMAATGRL